MACWNRRFGPILLGLSLRNLVCVISLSHRLFRRIIAWDRRRDSVMNQLQIFRGQWTAGESLTFL
jgi:hypothetical protein